MDEEKCNLKTENAFLKGEIDSSVLDSIDEINCMFLHNDTTGFSCISSHDVSSSSLINSPLVWELLISHGLLEKELVEKKPNFDTKICSIEDSYASPSFFHVDVYQSPTSSNIAEDNSEKDGYKCGWKSCDMYFHCPEDLAQHISSSHICQDKNSVYRCNWNGCIRQGKAINCRDTLLSHIRIHTHGKSNKCDVCGKEFSRVDHLRIHIRSHTGEKPYHCLVAGCNKSFTNTSDRHKHSKRHQDDKPFICHVEGCNKKYTDPSSLRVHKRLHAHGSIQNNSNSNSKDSNFSLLKRAAKFSNAYKPYACTFEGCNKKYTDPSSLRVHKRLHAHCSIQNNSKDSNSSPLKRDNKFSNTHKPYACTVEGCNKKYTDPSSLRKHKRSHAYGDQNNSDLNRTTKFSDVHKPYACKVEGCNKRYTDPSSLRKHKRSGVHGSIQNDFNSNSNDFNSSTLKKVSNFSNTHKPYVCKVEGCNKRYTDPSSLRKHQRVTSHGRDKNTFKKDVNRSS